MNPRTVFLARSAVFILLGLNLVVLIMGMIPVGATITEARYQVTPALPQIPGLPAGQSEPQAFLASAISLTIPSRFVGQKVSFREVVFMDAQRKEIGRVKVTLGEPLRFTAGSVQVQRRLKVEIQTPDGRTTTQETPEPVLKTLTLYPFEDGLVNVQVLTRSTLGVQQGDQLFVRIIGKAGLRLWSAEGKLTPPGSVPPSPQP